MMYTITQSRLLYVLSINDRIHRGLLKIGEVFVDNEISDNPSRHAKAVLEILNERPYMSGFTYNLEYVECTTYENSKCYNAYKVHCKLHAMGFLSKTLAKYKDPIYEQTENADIWFACTVSEIQQAIQQIKHKDDDESYGTIQFRPEQKKAINSTVKHFLKDPKKGRHYLWNAKMRFGKTLCGLEVAKQCGFRSTLIITHRPVVDKGWHDDFKKIFLTEEALNSYKLQGLEPAYGRRMMDDKDSKGDFFSLTKDVDSGKKILVFFVSMQYLRLSKFVGGKERRRDPLKQAIMEYNWDFVMVDEAHEGIDAAAGLRVMDKLKKENTCILSLSGTPFNLLDKYDESEIFTWDYVMEQKAKQTWEERHFGDPNPYADLPRMQILTFTLPKMLRDKAIENNEMFKFHEFFRVWTDEDKTQYQNMIEAETDTLKMAEHQAKFDGIEVGKFVYEVEINKFLDKLVEESETSCYPFSTDEFREHFRHTFWLLPGVKEAAALEKLLREHDVFGTENGMFQIINVAGDGNIEDKDGSALAEVLNNIRGNAKKNITKKDYTITLSCGKLTTGVSVPEWTAVLCMKGSEHTPAANYMQTIFRVQTHAVLDGRQKSDCYVFDFAPDRALTAVAETAKMAVYAQTEKGKKQLKQTQKKEEEHLAAFIKLCPVLSMDEGEMGKHFTATQIFEKLSNVYIERAVRSGYADNSIYDPEKLMNLTPEQEKALGDVHDLLGSMPASWKPETIQINKNGLGSADAEQVKYIYYLSVNNSLPSQPTTSANTDDNGRPMTEDEGWDEVMCSPSQMFPYLFVSHSQLVDGKWSSFSKPVLWKEWVNDDNDDKTSEIKKKKEQENKEKRARMSVLRGVAIRIPLLVYGAEINDDAGEEITIDNFASEEIVDQASWDEFMPKGFTKETFNILKDCFDRSIFTGAAKRIRAMVKEADNLSTEDRINKIATIFSYFHNPDKETVLTPWRVVNMHLSDCLGGWCFWNEEFDANYTEEDKYGEVIPAARFVDRGEVTKEVFGDYNARILEINSKTGLYPLYMAYSMFKQVKEPAYFNEKLTGERGKNKNAEQYYHQAGNDLEIWKDVLQDNIFVVCRTPMAVSITKRTLAGFRKDVRMNVKCYEREVNGEKLDMISILRSYPEFFHEDIVRGNDFWHVYSAIPKANNEDINNMKFTAIVGNPPYQLTVAKKDTSNGQKSVVNIFQHFQIASDELAKYTSLIYPGGRWIHRSGKGLDTFGFNQINDPHLSLLEFFPNSDDIFEKVGIADGLSIVFKDMNKTADGFDYVYIKDGIRICEHTENPGEHLMPLNPFDVSIVESITKITRQQFSFMHDTILPRSLFSIESDFVEKNPNLVRNYVDGDMFFDPKSEIKLFTNDKAGKSGRAKWYVANKNVITTGKEYLDKWKVVVSSANAGGQKRSNQLAILDNHSAFGRSRVAIKTFDTRKEAENFYKYMKSELIRFAFLMTDESLTSLGKLVPDIGKYTDDNGILDFKKDINEQLYKLFDIKEEAQKHIRYILSTKAE